MLEGRRFIRRINVDFGNTNQQARGVLFEMLLPPSTPAKTAPPAKTSGGAKTSAPEEIADNKETHIKETHTNTAGVRVSSRFTLAECRRYAESLRADGITNPGGYATKIHRSGEADDLIAKFLEPVESAKAVDVSACPDCHGTGFYEPGGAGKGVARCKHERLLEARR